MDSDAVIYKLVGPILAKQDVQEAKTNVNKRVEFIEKEIKRMDALETDFQGKVSDRRGNIIRMQEEYRKIMT